MLAAGLIGQLQILSCFCYSLQFFVFFLRVGRFEREGVGTAFVHFDSFNVSFLWSHFQLFLKNCFHGNLIVFSNQKNLHVSFH
jgi:hypothetical protein